MAGSEWFSIEIASQPANVLSALLDEFARAWAAIGAPKGVAMFLAGKPGRDQVAWFTPETAQYLASFLGRHHAVASAAPDRCNSFLVGHDDDRQRVNSRGAFLLRPA